ncbi:MAG: hypothetical protein R3B70_17845 [Polyangiaceae bacterium]
MLRTIVLSLLATSALLAAGCTGPVDETDAEDVEVGAAQQGIGNDTIFDPPKGGNHFCSWCFWADDTQAAYRIMGGGAVDQGGGYLPVLDIDFQYRDQVLQNAIECALSSEQEVIDPVTNRSYSGHWGLATSWTTAALTTTQRRWVTACMAQRLNAYQEPVPILLEGRTPPIYRHSVYDSEMPWDESTVWGDLFSSVTPLGMQQAPFVLYACTDSDLLGTCTAGDTPEGWMNYRICDTSPQCGLALQGPCANPAVCQLDSAGYPRCNGDGVLYKETVHVQLKDGTCTPPP